MTYSWASDPEAFSAVLKALANPHRLRLLSTLMEGEHCNCELGTLLSMAPNLVSHHLHVLREAGLIESTRDATDARWIHYKIKPDVIEQVRTALALLFAADRVGQRRATCAVTDKARSLTLDSGEPTMTKARVLFVCIHNSARSQMAEAWLNTLYGEHFIAESAGLEPGVLNPYAVRVLQEEGIDIAGKATRDVFDVYRSGRLFRFVITVCDETAAERCPIFPGSVERLHWSFPDPGQALGDDEQKMAEVRAIRDQIRAKIETWAPTAIELVR